jgi:hypothetical protein
MDFLVITFICAGIAIFCAVFVIFSGRNKGKAQHVDQKKQ